MKRYKVLLADDHRMVAEGLQRILEPEYELVQIVNNGRALMEAALGLEHDIILVDISMPSLNGLDAVQQLRQRGCQSKIVILTMHKDVLYAKRAFDVGANGFVVKHSATDELLKALKVVLEGGFYITPDLPILLDKSTVVETGKSTEKEVLTPRQREVLQLFAEGYSAREVASELHISVRTAENHRAHIMKTIGLISTADLVRFAIRHGIVSAD